jgi:hypothetical protein
MLKFLLSLNLPFHLALAAHKHAPPHTNALQPVQLHKAILHSTHSVVDYTTFFAVRQSAFCAGQKKTLQCAENLV